MGRPAIVVLLRRKWSRELDYRLIMELWAFTANRIAVRFAYEWHNDSGNWCTTLRLTPDIAATPTRMAEPPCACSLQPPHQMHHELHNPEANTAEYGNGRRPRRQPPVALVLAPFLQQLLRFVLQLVRLRLELVRLRQRPVDACNLLTKVKIGGSVARARSTAKQCGPEKPENRRF